MFALVATVAVFVCTIGAAAFGMFLGTRLPVHHLSEQSKDTVNMVLAVLGTLTALVLGLMIASAKSSLENKVNQLEHVLAWTVQLDRTLAQYGSETQDLRKMMQQSVASRFHKLFRVGGMSEADVQQVLSEGREDEVIQSQILKLIPKDDAQRSLRETAIDINSKITETRWMAVFNTGRSIPAPFLVVLTFWMAAIFISFGIFAPRNGHIVATLVICALSVAAAIFLIVEMDQPFAGSVKVPIEPVEQALEQLNKP